MLRLPQSLVGFVCVAVLAGATGAAAQTPVPPPAALPSVNAPNEDRAEPFLPPPTDLEKRREEERRLREIVQQSVDRMKGDINQQLDTTVRNLLENAKPKGPTPGQPDTGAPGVAGDKGAGAPKTEAETADANYKEAYQRALDLAADKDPDRATEGRINLELLRRGRMPHWNAQEGVFFVGCINKRKYYRDRFGIVFTSELWFNGSTGAGGTGGPQITGAGQNYAAAQPTAGAGAARTPAAPAGRAPAANERGSSLAEDPCAD